MNFQSDRLLTELKSVWTSSCSNILGVSVVLIELQQWLITFCIAVDTKVAPTWFKQLQRKNRERVSERISCSNEWAQLIWSRIRGRAISLTAQPQTWCQLVSFLKPLETSRRKHPGGNREKETEQEEGCRKKHRSILGTLFHILCFLYRWHPISRVLRQFYFILLFLRVLAAFLIFFCSFWFFI